jgi:hypothetical protein
MPGGASVDGGRKENSPKVGRGRGEFDGNERAFVGDLWRTHYPRFDFELGLGIFDDNFGSFRERFRNNQHGAAGADRMSMAFEGLRLADNVNQDRHPEQDTLGAAAFLRRWRARSNDSVGGSRLDVRLRFHSSSPQKSISGATSSTPYSQPSGRGMPRQTMTAALLVSVARFVSARRCSS